MRDEPTPEQLEQSRAVRVARRQLERMEVSVHYLEQAEQLWRESNQTPDPDLEEAIRRARDTCMSLRERAEGWVDSRRRPKNNPTAETCTVYLDECGQHSIRSTDPFPVFVLAAVIIRDVDYPIVDGEWKRWKAERLGSQEKIVHEPDVRRGTKAFYGRPAAVKDLPNILRALDFAGISIVLHRGDFVEDFGDSPMDESLPQHAYLLALDFLMERVVLTLDRQYDGAKALVVAESRGPKEDAQLQHELARLHLQGTSYIAPGWFRQQLQPGIRFMGKKEHNTGLQLADLLARPVGEKVADPTSDPPRWEVFRDKLCLGAETKNSILGLKIVPWREKYKEVWKS